jgi:hypothetical protein
MLLLALHILERVHPGIHDVIEGHAWFDFAVFEAFIFLVTLRDPFAFLVVQCEFVGTPGLFDEARLRGRRLAKVGGVDKRPI